MGLKDIKEHAQKLKSDIPALSLTLIHKGTPWYAKLLAAIIVVYSLSPIDLMPDFVPALGYLDDVLLLPTMVWLTIKLSPTTYLPNAAQNSMTCGKTASRKNCIMPYRL